MACASMRFTRRSGSRKLSVRLRSVVIQQNVANSGVMRQPLALLSGAIDNMLHSATISYKETRMALWKY